MIDVLELFYDTVLASQPDVPPRAEWLEHARDNAELWPIQREGQLIGGIFIKGHTLHIAIKPEWHGRWATRAMLRGYRSWEHGCDLIATPRADNKEAVALCEHLGMQRRGPHGQFIIYAKEATPCL